MRILSQDPCDRFRILIRFPGIMVAVAVVVVLGARAEARASGMAPAVLVSRLTLANANETPHDNGPGPEIARLVSEETTQDKLVAWWKLDEADGRIAADSSGHAFAGTLIGNPQWQPTAGTGEEQEMAPGFDDPRGRRSGGGRVCRPEKKSCFLMEIGCQH